MRRIALGVAGMMIAGACSAATPGAGSASPSATATKTGGSSLSAALLVVVEGYPDVTGDSALTLDQAAALAPDPAAERGALERAGLVAGHIKLFSDEDGDAAQLIVYEVRDEAAARALREHEFADALGRGTGERFAVPDITAAEGVVASVDAGGGTASFAGVGFVRGSRLYLVAVLSATRRPTADEALIVARAQAAFVG